VGSYTAVMMTALTGPVYRSPPPDAQRRVRQEPAYRSTRPSPPGRGAVHGR
jgi:hypothetical protein